MKIVLASASPRRRELLSILGHDVVTMVPKTFELDASANLTPDRLALINARDKARAVLSELDESSYDIIIGADTVVVSEGLIFGKPRDYHEALTMLRQLSRRSHEVITAYTLIGYDRREVSQAVSSVVEFRALSEIEIETYLACNEWRDKAGGYGVQGFGAALIRRVVGSLTNVIGLPIEEVMADAERLIRA